MKIEIYNSNYKKQWDDFVRNSKNGTFLFYRDFIEYHGDRYKDYSLMFYVDDTLVALMPGHIDDKVYYTHKGLTYGGLIMNISTTAEIVLSIFEHLTFIFKQQGIKQIIYKAVPHIYHTYPAEEDLYALFRCGATIIERNISSTVLLTSRVPYSKSRKNGVKKSQKQNIRIELSDDLKAFWDILEANLQSRYGQSPVHSLSEIEYLKKTFPQNIYLYVAKNQDGIIQGGCVIFETEKLVHAQYSATTQIGKTFGVMDLLIDHIMNEYACQGKMYFDYGISNEKKGLYLNEKLIYQKEGFGGRGIVYDIYIIKI